MHVRGLVGPQIEIPYIIDELRQKMPVFHIALEIIIYDNHDNGDFSQPGNATASECGGDANRRVTCSKHDTLTQCWANVDPAL